jgi:hypothetical protein
MRCMVCGEEMCLVQAVPEGAMLVPGFEHHILKCPSCNDEERRLVFIDQPAPLSPSVETDDVNRDLLDASLQSGAGAEDKPPQQTTKSLPPASSDSRPPKSRNAPSPASRAWDQKAELHRARWERLCGRLGLRLASSKVDSPTGR